MWGEDMKFSICGRTSRSFLALLVSVASIGMIIPASAQGNGAKLDTQARFDSEIPVLVRARQIKSALQTDVLVQKKTTERGIVRARAIDLDFQVLQTVSATLAVAGGPQVIQIPFFEDTPLLAEITDIGATYSGGQAFTGHIPGVLHSTVVLVNNQGVVSINVSSPANKYAIHGSFETGYVASELRDLNLPDHVSPPRKINAAPLPEPLPRAVTVGDAIQTAADTGAVMDVMVVYTPVVRVNNGGTAQINANIDAQIVYTNQIYQNSGVVQRLRLVYRGEVAYAEVSIDTDLTRLQDPNDGFLDTVPVLRDIYKADFVSLWGNYPTTCGLGYEMQTENLNFAPNAYNAVNSPGCTGSGSATMAHELGHNMGLKHDNFVETVAISNVTPEAGGAAVDITYAHGYVDTVHRFRTVMAYDDQCLATAPGTPCTRIPNFSNPGILFNGFTTGNATLAHERQALNDTRETTANFRTGLPDAAFTGPGIVVFFPATYTVAESGGSVLLNVERHVGFMGAISVTYATVSGTATAGADFTVTTGTLNWASGDTSARTITVPILQDTILEGNESFTVTLSNPVGGVSIGALNGTTTAATVTITDDEPDNFPAGGVFPSGYSTPPASAASPWTVNLADGFQSPSSMQSAAVFGPGGSAFANSDLEYISTFPAGNMTFNYRVSSYSTGFGRLEFMIDGIVPAAFTPVGGETGWLAASVPLTAGTHRLTWRFKNSLTFPCANANPPPPGGGACADRAWIDNVTVPLIPTNSTTTLSSSRNPSVVGQAVTLTATVAGSSGIATGSVAFRDGGNLIVGCTSLPMVGGAAYCATSTLPKGARSITAQYSGNLAYSPSNSNTLVQNVQSSSVAPILYFLQD